MWQRMNEIQLFGLHVFFSYKSWTHFNVKHKKQIYIQTSGNVAHEMLESILFRYFKKILRHTPNVIH